MNFAKKIILAPMAGVSDIAFRQICKEYGADIVETEMVSSHALHYQDEKTAVLCRLNEQETPVGIQIFGCEPSYMKESATLLSSNTYAHKLCNQTPDFIDINMGCPVKKIVSSGCGSALLKNPSLCYEIAKNVVEGSRVPVTAKIRLGWDERSVNCLEIASLLEDAGVCAVTVHARTREQMYSPRADWSYIEKIKKELKIPVIGNGDIFCPEDAQKMMEQTGCDSIMVGRGALGNPFLFEQIKDYFRTGTYRKIDRSERIDVIRRHLDLMSRYLPERLVVCESRKHVSWYLHGTENACALRNQINSCETLEQMLRLLKD